MMSPPRAHKSRKRATRVLALLCSLCVLISTFAYFTDRANGSASATAGNMDLVFTDISASKTGTNGITSNNEFALDKSWNALIVENGAIINPGDYFDLSYQLSNTGSKSMDVRQQLTVTSTVPMTEDAGEYQLTITGGNNTTAVAGVMSADKMSITYDLADIILDGSVETETGAVDGKFIVQLDFLRSAGNAFMGSSVTVAYKAQAKQHRNTSDADWATWAEYETKFEQVGSNTVTLSGDGQEFYTLAPSTLTFRSTAPLDEFQEVKVNGVTVDPSNYTVTEGSTIITLSIDYLKTLPEAGYEITVVSDSGSPSAGFSVVEPDLNEHGFYYNQPYTAYVSAFGGNTAFFIREGGQMDVIVTDSGYTEVATYTAVGNTMTVNAAAGTFTGTFTADGMEVYVNELSTTFVLGDESIVADEDYIYVYDSSLGGYSVTAIDKTKAEYGAIKTGINGLPTVMLADDMFHGNTNIEVAPEIPDSVTSIGHSAFWGCSNLTSVTIPRHVTNIEFLSFAYCENLTNIVIPASVTNIGHHTFAGCTSLSGITFEGTTEQWNAIMKGDNWNFNVPATEVVCSDGVVSLV